MSNALTMFSPGAAVPAHIANMRDELDSNMLERIRVNSLTYTGKVWSIQVDGNKQQLNTRTADGDVVPVQVLRVIILGFAKRRGRAYYENGYDPNNVQPPKCWAPTGEEPDPSVQEPQSDKCATCQWAVKGSKTNDAGQPVAACGSHRMLAIVPSQMVGKVPALRLKIAVTSDYDKQSPDQNKEQWFAFSDYVDWLNSNGVKHTAEVITAMKFDPNEAYPKLFFRADGWVSAETQQAILPMTKDEEVAKLITESWTPAGVDGVRNNASSQQASDAPAEPAAEAKAPAKPKPAPKPKAEKPAPVPQAAPEPEIEDTGLVLGEAEPQVAPVADVGDDIMIMGDDEPAPATKPAKVATPVAQASTEVPSEIDSILAEWDA